jgi:hypothetical protein
MPLRRRALPGGNDVERRSLPLPDVPEGERRSGRRLAHGADNGVFIHPGTPGSYRSSPRAVRHFCGACGSQLTSRLDENPSEVDVNLATFDHPEVVAPQYHIYTASQMPWLVIQDDRPRFPGDRP